MSIDLADELGTRGAPSRLNTFTLELNAMISRNVAVVAAVVSMLGLVTVGCRNKDEDNADGAQLGTSEAQLVEDDSEASDTDDDLESGLDEPLSGATETDPGSPADGDTDDALLAKVKENAGHFFKPAGCLVSTVEGKSVKHVFNKCKGPWDMAEFNGTITSTWTREPGKLTVTHSATGLTANGASISGSRVVVYTRNGSVITKTRTGDWTGTTAKGKPIEHQASFVTTYDSSTKCLTRDGSAQTTIGGRSYERVVDNYKRCGIGRLGCPESGKITLSRTKSSETLTLTIEFLGGTSYRVTRPNGRQVDRVLLCRAS